jgi:hypothetical protein
MLRKLLRAFVIGASAAALAACGGQSGAGELTGKDHRGGSGYGMLSGALPAKQSEQAARAIERLDGISQADVRIQGSTVYVTVRLDHQAPSSSRFGRTHAKGSTSARSWGQKGNYYGTADSRVFPTVPGWDNDRLRRSERGSQQRTGVTGVRGTDRRDRSRIISSNKDTVDMYGYGRQTGWNGPQNGPRSMEGFTGMTGSGVSGVSALNAQVRGQIENVVRTIVRDVDKVYVSTDLDMLDDMSPLQPGGPANNSFDPDHPRHRTGMRLR